MYAGDGLASAEGPFDDAEASYARALELLDVSPGPSADLRYIVLVNRGVMRFQRGNPSASIADLTAATQLAPELSSAYAELGTVLARTGKPVAAAERFGEAIARNPQPAALYRARADIVLLQKAPTIEQIESALRDLGMALRFEPSGSPLRARDFANRAWLLNRTGRLTEALAANDEALRALPDYGVALNQKIDVLICLKRFDQAAEACDAALARGSHQAWLYKYRALTREAKNDHVGAAADFTEAIRQTPDDQELRTRRGWAYLACGAAKLALQDFDRVVQLDRSNADAYAGRGVARATLGMPREAAADAEQSLRIGGTGPRRLFGAARTYAMAAPALANEVGKNGRTSSALAQRFEERAVALLNDSVSRQPSSARDAFIREMIASDPVLSRFRRRIRASSTNTTPAIAKEPAPALAQGIMP